ncbi:HAMP domain-containing histidine kinase [Kribbella antibiotica]|uniref:Signal transduction histidine-protein kinase/phosphatase MprB n=1 Tax=Kribbella antibiotica TaxID=190195 RepID=A0A4R4Z540_9ACTN|nr:HAMP domain-containing sensor histidine kinase [Kribbella antibiotica]TDD53208.1 HAMP domain-containing histidine kinase [Kribbella antibiotica]
MRARLMGVLAVVSFVLLAALVIPFLDSVSDTRTQGLQLARNATLDRFAGLAGRAAASGDYAEVRMEAARHFELYDESVVVADASGQVVVSTGGMTTASPGVGAIAELAARDLPQLTVDTLRPWSSSHRLIAAPVGSPQEPAGAVVLAVDAGSALADVRRSWVIICAAAVAAQLLLLFMASKAARWVIRPVGQLEDAVVELGRSGGWNQSLEASGPPELRRLARSVEVMGATVQRSIDVQRQMVADSSHQLRNPLASLRLRVDAMDPGTAGLAHVQHDLERLEDVLAGLLKLAAIESRITDGLRESSSATCLVEAVLQEEIDIWQPTAADITLSLDVTEGLVAAVDDHDLGQLVGVLLDNAIKYGGNQVIVSSTRGDDGLLIQISDNGPGLPAADLPLATQRFWRGTSKTQGTGLGLAIADQTAIAIGGRLELSATVPHGLTATIQLPEAT